MAEVVRISGQQFRARESGRDCAECRRERDRVQGFAQRGNGPKPRRAGPVAVSAAAGGFFQHGGQVAKRFGGRVRLSRPHPAGRKHRGDGGIGRQAGFGHRPSGGVPGHGG